MKFLTIGGKLQKDANGKLITVPDNYAGKLIKLNGKLYNSFLYLAIGEFVYLLNSANCCM